MRQRSIAEYEDHAGKKFRVCMEQTLTQFEISDLPRAIDCILQLLGGTGKNVMSVVCTMLVARAIEREGTQKKAADKLGISTRMMHYHYHTKGLSKPFLLEE